jgi:hypothetical protein
MLAKEEKKIAKSDDIQFEANGEKMEDSDDEQNGEVATDDE